MTTDTNAAARYTITRDDRHWPFEVCGQRFPTITAAQAYVRLQKRIRAALAI